MKIPDRKVTSTCTIASGIEEAVYPVHHLLCSEFSNSLNNYTTKPGGSRPMSILSISLVIKGRMLQVIGHIDP